MNREIRNWWILPMIFLIAGCGNKLVYFENTAFKLGISVGEDPSKPASVTTGLDRRLVAVIPPRKLTILSNMAEDNRPNISASRNAADEAVSVASSFSLEYRALKDDGETSEEHCIVKIGDDRLGLFSQCRLTLTSTFVTGKAAERYTENYKTKQVKTERGE